eukprot:2168238-Rhodomonas_salina.1
MRARFARWLRESAGATERAFLGGRSEASRKTTYVETRVPGGSREWKGCGCERAVQKKQQGRGSCGAGSQNSLRPVRKV